MSENRQPAAVLREEITASSSAARRMITGLFDEGTFLETGTYRRGAENGKDFEGVITGCGAVCGQLVFCFIEDYENGRGAFTAAHAEKICDLYDKADRAGAPVVGVFNSAGAKMTEGIGALSGYGRVMKKAARKKTYGETQIAVIAGPCGGVAAALASMSDFVITDREKGRRYVLPQPGEGKNRMAGDMTVPTEELAEKVRSLLAFLADGEENGAVNEPMEDAEVLITAGGDVRELIAALADGGAYLEVGDADVPEMVTALLRMNGRLIGVVANQPTEAEGALTGHGAGKAAGFVNCCRAAGRPVLTLVNTVGLGGKDCRCFGNNLAALASAYAGQDFPKVTAIVGNAFGSGFTLMGSKALGADFVFATDNSVIGVMPPDRAVEFLYDAGIREAADPDAARAAFREEYVGGIASPLAAARNGDIDDIVSYDELKQRIAAAFEVLS